MPRKSDRKISADNPTVAAPHDFTNERTTTNNLIRTGNAVHKVDFAKNLAFVQARLSMNSIVRTQDHSYRVLREVVQGVFGYTYEVKQKGGPNYFLRTEPLTANEDVKRFKTLKYELMILKLAWKTERSDIVHFPFLHDSACTDEFKFIVTQALGSTLYDITRKQLNSAFTMSTALRVAIQILRAVGELHALGFLHRFLRPQSFSIGLGSKIRTIYFADFGSPYMFRDPKTKKIRKPRKHIRVIGTLRYMSRNSQLNKEHGRRDDLEAWAYLTMEFFDLNILPWRSDQVNSAVLDKKQKLIDGAFPMIFVKTTLRYRQILRYVTNMKFHERPDYEYIQSILQEIRVEKNVDFDLPYDWENITKARNVIEKEQVSDELPLASSPKSDPEGKEKVLAVKSKSPPKKGTPMESKGPSKMEEASPSAMPATVPVEDSGGIPSGDPAVNQATVGGHTLVDRIIDVDMKEGCLNLLDKKHSHQADNLAAQTPEANLSETDDKSTKSVDEHSP